MPNASSPSCASITISTTTTLKAYATESGDTDSDVASATFTITPQAATPTFTPAAGTYSAPTSVSIADSTPGASISYTVTTGSTTSAATTYAAPFMVSVTSTVSATATATGYTQSAVATATYTINIPVISVSVTPSSASLTTLHSQQFTATVANTTNLAVTWSVNGVVGGSAGGGTITATGLYTAPPYVYQPPTDTITATSVADSTKSASVQVTITAPPVPTGTWSYLGPDGATDSVQFVADPNNSGTLYAAPIHGGLYKTTNLGGQWSQILATTGLPFSLVVAPMAGTLYALSENQFQTSVDGGKTFSSPNPYPNKLDTETTGLTFAVDPKNDQMIYISTPTSLLLSKDGGSTWTSLTTPPSSYLTAGIQSPGLEQFLVSSASSSNLMSASTSGFAISKDGGTTWQLQNTGLDPSFSYIRQIVQDPANPNRLLCFGSYSAPQGTSPYAYIYVSTDSGMTWTHEGTSIVYGQLVGGQTGPGVFFVSSGSLYVTYDQGATYTNIGPTSDASGYTATISPISPSVIAYEGLNDIFVSQDGGSTWAISETGMNARVLEQVVYAGTTGPLYVQALPIVGPEGYSAQIWRTPEPVQPWTHPVDAYSGLSIFQFDVDPANPLHLLGVEQEGTSPASVLSSDGGSTWTQVPYASGMAAGFALGYSGVRFGAPSSNVAFACGTFGVARLSTLTNAWTIINNGIPASSTCTALGVDQATPGTVYAGTTSGVYKSTDGGDTWSLIFADTGSYVSILVDPKISTNVFLSAGVGGSSGMSQRSTDGGKTWEPMYVEGVMALDPTNSSLMYAVDSDIFCASSDSGVSWAHITPPVNFLRDVTVTSSGAVIISTYASGVIQFTPN